MTLSINKMSCFDDALFGCVENIFPVTAQDELHKTTDEATFQADRLETFHKLIELEFLTEKQIHSYANKQS